MRAWGTEAGGQVGANGGERRSEGRLGRPRWWEIGAGNTNSRVVARLFRSPLSVGLSCPACVCRPRSGETAGGGPVPGQAAVNRNGAGEEPSPPKSRVPLRETPPPAPVTKRTKTAMDILTQAFQKRNVIGEDFRRCLSLEGEDWSPLYDMG